MDIRHCCSGRNPTQGYDRHIRKRVLLANKRLVESIRVYPLLQKIYNIHSNQYLIVDSVGNSWREIWHFSCQVEDNLPHFLVCRHEICPLLY
jgi:hypothetical protein